MIQKWSSRLTFFAFVVLMVGLGSNDSLRGIFSCFPDFFRKSR